MLNKKAKPKKLTLLSEAFFSWSKQVDINSYNKIFAYKQNKACQFVWLVIFLVLTCATFWIIILSIVNYLNYDVVTQIRVVYERPTQFPTVTICDNEAFKTYEAQILYEKIATQSGHSLKYISKVNETLNRLVKMHVASGQMSDEEIKKLGFNRSLIMLCRYFNDACEDSLHWFYSFYYGNCWQFNAGVNLTNHKIKIKEATLDNGIGLSMIFHPLTNNNSFMTTWESGMVVFIHNNSFKPKLNDRVYIDIGEYLALKNFFH